MRIIQFIGVYIVAATLFLSTVATFTVTERWFATSFHQLETKGVVRLIPPSVAEYEVKNVLAYFAGRDQLDPSLYSPREFAHLVDVKHLLDATRWLFASLAIVSLIIVCFLVRAGQTKIIGNLLLSAGILVGMVGAGLGSVIAVSFDAFFLQFHRIAFNNTLWLLDPEKENLVVVFPAEIFFLLGQKWIWHSASLVVAAMVVGIALRVCQPNPTVGSKRTSKDR